MVVLSDQGILNEMEKEEIVISPFSEDQLQSASYDVCLGRNFYRFTNSIGLLNYLEKEEMMKSYQVGETILIEDLEKNYSINFPEEKRKKKDVILLSPGETILAHTEEYIGARNFHTTKMFCRSSYGRLGISVCMCAGLGDVGYVNRWTMEITNRNENLTVPLFVGSKIAQIAFYTLDQEPKRKYQGYQIGEEPWKNWFPEQMLPRLYQSYS